MSHVIQILRDNRVEKTLNLEAGTYTVGRSPASAIVLSDSAVSKNHATLTIDGQGIGIRDNGSANGIYFKGNRITEHRFSDDFEVVVGPFSIRDAAVGNREETPGNKTVRQGLAGRIRQLSVGNIKISLFLLITFVMVMTIIIGFRPMKQQVSELHRQEFLRTGILLTRYLAEMNRPFLEDGQQNRVKVSPISQEDGVIYAFVLDAYGRIIAPHENQGNFFDWDGLSAAFQSGQLTMADGQQQEKLIFYPIGYQNTIIGAAVTGYAYKQMAAKNDAGLGGTVVVLLMVLFGISMFLTWYITRAFLNPLKTVNEEVEIAIKENRSRVMFKAPYQELSTLVQNVNRLLMRRAEPGPGQQAAVMTSAKDMTGTGQGHGDKKSVPKPECGSQSLDASTDGLREPWLIIDKDSFTVSRVSDTICQMPWAMNCRPDMHLIEAFDPEIIQATSQLMDAQEGAVATFTHQNRQYELTRVTAGHDNHVTLTVTVKQDQP
ncbi:MAG: FHA domain-containing protein [Pseudomonadota bacterium]